MCGFHGASNRPYHDVGGLVLDDRRLILEGLGLEQDKEDVSLNALNALSCAENICKSIADLACTPCEFLTSS